MALPLSQLPFEIIRDVRSRKWPAFFLFLVVSSIALLVGFIYPYQYASEVVIFVDDQNIIRPLMEGSAVATKISDRASAAKELLWGRNIIDRVAEDANIWGSRAADFSNVNREAMIASLRSAVKVKSRGDNYFSIGYESDNPRIAFLVAQRFGQVFIEESGIRKKEESRKAYEFIDKQVKAYESQIALTDEQLKTFLSENVEGTEEQANSRLAQLRSKIELAELELREMQAKQASLDNQLAGASRNLAQQVKGDSYQQRILGLQDQLDALRLKYRDVHPDIVGLREQIEELKRQQLDALSNPNLQATSQSEVANPFYQELQGERAKVVTEIQSIQTRILALNTLLAAEKTRMERIQTNKAELSGLTRDMEVNKQIYDDLLKRRERARVSMRLDIEGQGLNYRIQEAAQYPLSPTGIQFFHIAGAGLLLGLVAPFLLAGGLLQMDSRIRTRTVIEESLGFPVLAVIPEVRTPYEKRLDRKRTVAIGFCVVLVISGYLLLVVLRSMGVVG